MRSSAQGMSLTTLFALAIIFLLNGCLAVKKDNANLFPGESGVPFAPGTMSASSYPHETKKWQDVVQENSEPPQKAKAHLHLAALYLAKDNPQKDYHLGYVELVNATTVWPDLLASREIASWLELLARFENDSHKATKNIADLEQELARAKRQIATQRQEMVKLQETLDKLKRLEMSVERKRRTFK